MFSDNRHYGHARILRRHCGVRGRPSIPGRLQHGWTPGPGLGDACLAEPWPKLIWSRRNAEQCRERGVRHAVPIGAPVLYLPEPEDPPPQPEPRSLVVVPFHGWERQSLHDNLERYARSLDVLAADGLSPVTVCLYWTEYEDAATRAVFERRGFSVTTNGHREGNPQFLERQRSLILGHACSSSNRVCTAAFYALALGRPFFLHGPPAGLSGTDDPGGEAYDAWQREEYPMPTRDGFGDRAHREVGEAELGLEHKRTPEALRELFGWSLSGLPLRAFRQVQRRLWGLHGR